MSQITEEPLAELARDIIAAVGGAGNIRTTTHCMTRLRMTLSSDDNADIAALRKLPGVSGAIHNGGQLQVVIGPGKVAQVTEAVQAALASTPAMQPAAPSASAPPAPNFSAQEVAKDVKASLKAKQSSAVQKFLSTFATIFTPLIPGFLAAGLLLGLATVLEQLHLTGSIGPLILYMKVFSKGLFTFLGIMVGYNAAAAFGGSGVNGAILGSLFLLDYGEKAAGVLKAPMTDFFSLSIDPRGGLVGILIAAIIGAKIEKQVRKRITPNLDIFLTSLITLLIAGALTYVAIMPIGVWLFHGMSWLFLHLNSNPFGAAVLAGLFLLAVVFGVHQGFVPVYMSLVQTAGMNTLFPILSMAGAGQVGASLALYARAKQGSVIRQQIKGAIIPGFLGIGEPLIYGVTLPRMKPFITACCGGAVGGFVTGLIAWLGFPVGLNTVFGPSGLVALPLMTSHSGVFMGMLVYLVGVLSAYLSGFIFTYLFATKGVDLD